MGCRGHWGLLWSVGAIREVLGGCMGSGRECRYSGARRV